jgi:GntR family transcriptional regulator, phosphonate transport system regulatory protein
MDAAVDRTSPIPAWHQVELALQRQIESGLYQPGTRLPNEADLAARFGVHRHTARRALATLADRGVVRIRRGLGTFVETPFLSYPITERTRFTATLQDQNRAAQHDLLEARDEPADETVAAKLRLPPGTAVTALRTLGLADGVPVNIGTTWLEAARFPGLPGIYAVTRSLTAALARFGVDDYRRTTTAITAALPTDEEASLLRQPRRSPVLAVESLDVDAAGRPLSVGRVRFAGERVQLMIGG